MTTETVTSTGGAVVSYSVSPSLPAGLSLDTSTGSISGTPTAVTSSATYTITATNSGGTDTASMTIVVNDVAPTIAYGSNSLYLEKGTTMTTETPTVKRRYNHLMVSFSNTTSRSLSGFLNRCHFRYAKCSHILCKLHYYSNQHWW